MKQTVEKGKTLLVDGPASVSVVSGKVEIFGSSVNPADRIVVRDGKRLPFTIGETAVLDIFLGENARIEEVDGTTIPSTWIQSCEETLKLQTKPAAILVIGTVDSGKTSFCTYLANKLLSNKRTVAILDGDLGQSDIGPPCTISYAFVKKPLVDLFNLEAENAFFVGVTSPSAAINKVVDGLVKLKKEIYSSNVDFVIINTDGWVEGEEAVNYKVQLVKELNPDIIFCIQQKDELVPLMNVLEKFKKFIVESPSATKQRSKEKRKSLRELGYIKYLKNAKVQSFPLGWLKIEEDEFHSLERMFGNTRTQSKMLIQVLGLKPLNAVEFKDKICIFLDKNQWIREDSIKKAEEYFKKKITVIRKGDEKGLLTALYDANRKFLGIGILREIDYAKRNLKIYTPVSGEISIVALGKVRLEENFKEVPIFAEGNALKDSA